MKTYCPGVSATERTPLVEKATDIRPEEAETQNKWQIWRSTSPSHRFFLLFFTCCIPFGGHFIKHSMSPIEELMLNDPEFPINNTMYGALISAVSIPGMFIPFLGGVFLDKRGHAGVIIFLLCMLVGQVFFTLAMQLHYFWWAMLGRVLVGIGEGSVVVASRVIVSHWFEAHELTFAMGSTVAMANVSKMLAKATVAPVALYFGGYIYALWYTGVICLFSLFMGAIVMFFTRRLKCKIRRMIKSGEEVDPKFAWFAKCIERKKQRILAKRKSHPNKRKIRLQCHDFGQFSSKFWVLTLLHVVFVNVFHLFQNVSSSYLYQRYGYSVVYAGILSSLSHSCVVLAPLIGMFVDRTGRRMPFILCSSILSIFTYVSLLYTDIDPLLSMILISLCLSFTPTILMGSIPLTVSSSSFGIAFGIVEITDAIVATFGNIGIGYVRDVTGSYFMDMQILLGLACSTFFLTILLWKMDCEQGEAINNPHVSQLPRFASVDDEDPCIDIMAEFGDSSTDQENSPDRARRLQDTLQLP